MHRLKLTIEYQVNDFEICFINDYAEFTNATVSFFQQPRDHFRLVEIVE